jgi:hypothetical protein
MKRIAQNETETMIIYYQEIKIIAKKEKENNRRISAKRRYFTIDD